MYVIDISKMDVYELESCCCCNLDSVVTSIVFHAKEKSRPVHVIEFIDVSIQAFLQELLKT